MATATIVPARPDSAAGSVGDLRPDRPQNARDVEQSEGLQGHQDQADGPNGGRDAAAGAGLGGRHAGTVSARADGRIITASTASVLRLLTGQFVAVCTCQWIGEKFHRKHDDAQTEAIDHQAEHDVDDNQLQLVETNEQVPYRRAELGEVDVRLAIGLAIVITAAALAIWWTIFAVAGAFAAERLAHVRLPHRPRRLRGTAVDDVDMDALDRAHAAFYAAQRDDELDDMLRAAFRGEQDWAIGFSAPALGGGSSVGTVRHRLGLDAGFRDHLEELVAALDDEAAVGDLLLPRVVAAPDGQPVELDIAGGWVLARQGGKLIGRVGLAGSAHGANPLAGAR